MTVPMTRSVSRAVAKYSAERCREAFRLHSVDGEGASTVGIYVGLTTRQADAAINAGAVLAGEKGAAASRASTPSPRDLA